MNDFPYPGKYTFVDVEIPNLNNDCICAISIIVIENRKEVVRHTELINPQTFFSAENIAIHHIGRKDVLEARTLEQFWKDYGKYFQKPYIIGAHNANSDISVLNKDLERIGTKICSEQYIDTMDIMEKFYYKGNQCKGDLKLSSIAKRLEIELDHHNPQSDVNACYEIVCYMHHYFAMDLEPFIRTIRPPKKKKARKAAVPSAHQMRIFLRYTRKQIARKMPAAKISMRKAKHCGDEAYGAGDYEGAVFNYEIAASKRWATPIVYLRLAEIYDSLHMQYEALQILERGIRNLSSSKQSANVLRAVSRRIRSAKRQKKEPETTESSENKTPESDA